MKSAEAAYDAADARFTAAERALDEAREERAVARRERYAARQAHERAAITAERLQRRERELSERLDGTAELTSTVPRRACDDAQGSPPTRRGTLSTFPRPGRYSRAIRGLS